MIKSILVGLESAENNPIVTKYAMELGKFFNAGVTGMHVLDIRKLYSPFVEDVFYSMGMASVPNFQDIVRKRLVEIREILRDSFELDLKDYGVRGEFRSGEGIVSEVLTAESHSHDLLVIGTKGERFRVAEILLGSTFEEVVRRVNRPIIVVPAACQKFYVKKILLAYDGSDKASNALQFVVNAIEGKGIALEYLVVQDSLIEDAQAAFSEGKRYLENRNVPYQATLLQGEAVELILQHAKLNHCDMIVMGSYDRSFLKNLLLGSTTEELLSKVNLPTLLMR